MYRKNKSDQWIGTLSYNFTRPVSNKGISRTLKVALLLREEKPKTRGDILYAVGVKKDRAYKKGQYASLFTALVWNKVIEYDKKVKHYIKGERYAEFMEYTNSIFASHPELKKKFKKEYNQVLLEVSPYIHYVLN